MVLIGMPEAARRSKVSRSSIKRALENAGVTLHKINEKAFAVEEADLAKYVEQHGGELRRGRPRRYDASKGGHAPGYLREAFTDWIELEEETATVEVDGELRPIEWLLGQLWNCTDCLPASDCRDLDMQEGSTYAQAVRQVKADIEGEAAAKAAGTRYIRL